MTKALSTALSARSDGLDDIHGGPECGVYTQMRGIEQVCILRGLKWSRGSPGIAFVAPQQVGQDLVLVGRFAPRLKFKDAPGGAHFRRRDNE
jgi:hypothetical protein